MEREDLEMEEKISLGYTEGYGACLEAFEEELIKSIKRNGEHNMACLVKTINDMILFLHRKRNQVIELREAIIEGIEEAPDAFEECKCCNDENVIMIKIVKGGK